MRDMNAKNSICCERKQVVSGLAMALLTNLAGDGADHFAVSVRSEKRILLFGFGRDWFDERIG